MSVVGVPGIQTLCHGWRSDSAQPITVDDLVPAAYDQAVAGIPLPDVAVSPPVSSGSLVNFGMWLAVGEEPPVSARATAGSVWAEVTATVESTTFAMGNGDIVSCDGVGDELEPGDVGWDSVEPSPTCGYVYRLPSASEITGTGIDAYALGVTTRWQIRVRGSDGRDAALTPIDSQIVVDHVVHEVQTVGAA